MWTKLPKCDVCGKTKGVGNRWLLAVRHTSIKEFGRCRLAVFDWSDALAAKPGVLHICGEGCLSTLFSRAMENRTSPKIVEVKNV